mmetsp:Transcript_18358/g.61771  ORF Transcript_18358/g.61771 Transcript_18358/m.61771 type:complete len:181 (+) Transcript_18358:3-545(+)
MARRREACARSCRQLAPPLRGRRLPPPRPSPPRGAALPAGRVRALQPLVAPWIAALPVSATAAPPHNPTAVALRSWGPRWAATARRWWGWRCDRVVAGTLPVACVGLYHSLYAAWLQNRHVSNSWIIGLLTMFATNGMRFTRVLVAIGLAHSCRSAYHQCQHLSKRALTRWGTRILNARA